MPRRKYEDEEEDEESSSSDDYTDTEEDDEGDGKFSSARDFLASDSVKANNDSPSVKEQQKKKNTRRGFFTASSEPSSASTPSKRRDLFSKASASPRPRINNNNNNNDDDDDKEDTDLSRAGDLYIDGGRRKSKKLGLIGAIEQRHNDKSIPDTYATASAALRSTGMDHMFRGKMDKDTNLNMFVPSDAAFNKLPKEEVRKFKSDKEFAKAVMSHFIVEDQPGLGPRVGQELDHRLNGKAMDTVDGRTSIRITTSHDRSDMSKLAKAHLAAQPTVSLESSTSDRVHQLAHRADAKHLPGFGTIHFIDTVFAPEK